MNWQDYMNTQVKNIKKTTELMYKISHNPEHKNRDKWIKQLKSITPADEIEYLLETLGVE